MKIPIIFAGAALAFGAAVTAPAQDARQDLARSLEALKTAPAYRLTMVSSDANTRKAMTITMEKVNPDLIHLREESDGAMQMEVVSDGKATYLRQGAGGKLEPAPPAMASIFTTLQQSMSAGTAMEGLSNVKLDGHETIGGVPTTVYTTESDKMGLHTTARFWVSDQNHLPLKSDSDSAGEIKLGNRPGRKVNRHTAMTFDYDPTIKITLPDGH